MRLASVLILLAVSAAPHAQIVSPDTSRTDPVAADSAAAQTVGIADPLTGEVPTEAPPPYRSLDAKGARTIYRIENPLFAGAMRVSNETAFPVFALAAPASGAIALARGESLRPAVRLGVSQVGTVAVVLALKNVLRRPRPYRAMEEITARDRRYTGDAPLDPHSFPSGHAALAFAVATSATLSDARLAAPAYIWATTTTVARIWHGVHYPSDVLVGATIGAGAAALVHVVLPSGSSGDEVIPFQVVVPL